MIRVAKVQSLKASTGDLVNIDFVLDSEANYNRELGSFRGS